MMHPVSMSPAVARQIPQIRFGAQSDPLSTDGGKSPTPKPPKKFSLLRVLLTAVPISVLSSLGIVEFAPKLATTLTGQPVVRGAESREEETVNAQFYLSMARSKHRFDLFEQQNPDLISKPLVGDTLQRYNAFVRADREKNNAPLTLAKHQGTLKTSIGRAGYEESVVIKTGKGYPTYTIGDGLVLKPFKDKDGQEKLGITHSNMDFDLQPRKLGWGEHALKLPPRKNYYYSLTEGVVPLKPYIGFLNDLTFQAQSGK